MARPLTKRDKQGALYARPNTVELTLDALHGLNDWGDLGSRARVTNRQDARYLPSECLVHLLREAIRRGDDRVATQLMSPLLVRCEAILLRTVPDHLIPKAEAIREEILSSFQLLFTDDAAADALDFYECQFRRAFKALRVDHVRKALIEAKQVTEIPVAEDEDGEAVPDEQMLAVLSRSARNGPAQENTVYLAQVLKAIKALPPDQKRAVVLRRIIGLTEDEAAKLCGVEGRTIRYRLARADERLKSYKEDL